MKPKDKRTCETRVRDVLWNRLIIHGLAPFLYKRATYGEKKNNESAKRNTSLIHKTEYWTPFKTIPGQPATRYATGPLAANKRPEMSGQEERHNSRGEPEGGGGRRHLQISRSESTANGVTAHK